MKKNIYLLSFIFLSSFVAADYKQLNCSKGPDQWIAVFDTQDLTKSDARYELTWITFGGSPSMEGQTFRNKMVATPSTISLEYCGMPGELLSMYPNCIGRGGFSMWMTWDINRKDLSLKNGSCTLEDYVSENIL
jgi:hypothetical protein